MKWEVAITTSPRRECTLQQCIESIRDCGWEPTIYAEPESTLTDCLTIANPIKLGIWYNWVNSVKCSLKTNADVIMTVQDDALFHPDSKHFVESIMWPSPDCGFISLYTPKHYTIRRDKTIRNVGVNKIVTKSLWGACALVWPREVLEKVIQHPLIEAWAGAPPKSGNKEVIQRRKDNPHTITNSDTAIGKIMNRMKDTMWFVDPSPVQHIAKFSTISNGDNIGIRKAYRIADHSIPLEYQVLPCS